MLKADYNLPKAQGELIYKSAEYSLDTLDRTAGGSSLLVNDIQLELSEEGVVCAVWGMCPHTTWRNGGTLLPFVRPGALVYRGTFTPGISTRINSERWPVRHDPRTGWIVLSRTESCEPTEAVEFLPNCLAGFLNNELVCLWLKPRMT